MRALVTGANGFLGQSVVDRLLAHGVTGVRCFVRIDGYRARFDGAVRRYGSQAVECFVGNLLSHDDAKEAIQGVDVVCHLAASLKGSAAEMFMNTVVASKTLLEAIAGSSSPPRTLLVSSMSVYGVAPLPKGHVIDERVALETHPERRDLYSHAKWRQETLFREYARRHGIPLIVMRPGVVYGPGGSAMSTRVGLDLFGLFLHLGGSNVVPITFVENCAEAIALASLSSEAVGKTYNVVDDDLLTSREYLRRYRKEVKRLRYIRIPYRILQALSHAVMWYSRHSKGQLPAVFTPYKTASIWKGFRYDNTELRRLGWKPLVSTEEGLRRTFSYVKNAGRTR